MRLLTSLNCEQWLWGLTLTLQSCVPLHNFTVRVALLTSAYKMENRENTWNRELAKEQGKNHEEARQTFFLNNELEEEIKDIFLLNNAMIKFPIILAKFSLWILGKLILLHQVILGGQTLNSTSHVTVIHDSTLAIKWFCFSDSRISSNLHLTFF